MLELLMRIRKQASGFSLIEMAMVLVIMGLVAGALLTLGTKASEASRRDLTFARMDAIERAMGGFLYRNGRLPCPAQGHIAPGAAGYGTEPAVAAGPATDCATTRIVSGGVQFHVGAIPIVSLGLSDEFMLDGWNRRFTYVVDERFLDDATTLSADAIAPDAAPANDGRLTVFVTSNAGTDRADRITSTGGVLNRGAAMVIISHGANGYGAWPARNPAGNSNRIYNNPTSLVGREGELENAHSSPVPANNTPLSFDAEFTQQEQSGLFDDWVRFYMREDLIRLAGGLVDFDICEMAARARLPVADTLTPPEGPVGCVDDGSTVYDQNCLDVQRRMADAISRLCFISP